MIRWLSQVYTPNRLTELRLQPIGIEASSGYCQMVQAISDNCPKLQILRLEAPFSQNLIPEQVDPVTFDLMKSIMACTDLRTLDLSDPSPFLLADSDIISLLKSLPRLTELSLNPPPRQQPLSFDMAILPAILPYCQNILHLGLYMDASVVPQMEVSGRFPRLHTLNVGNSPSGPHPEAAMFLSAVLPMGCWLLASHRLNTGDQRPWAKTEALLPAFISVREEERRRK